MYLCRCIRAGASPASVRLSDYDEEEQEEEDDDDGRTVEVGSRSLRRTLGRCFREKT